MINIRMVKKDVFKTYSTTDHKMKVLVYKLHKIQQCKFEW